jgi:hypothetical protein
LEGIIIRKQESLGIIQEDLYMNQKTWITKAYNRKLISNEDYQNFFKEINNIGVKLNNYINSIGKTH